MKGYRKTYSKISVSSDVIAELDNLKQQLSTETKHKTSYNKAIRHLLNNQQL